MEQEELKEAFEQQAPGYDQQSAKIAPLYSALHFLLGTVFSDLPSESRVLCVGVGTGAELVFLAQKFPQWRFTALDPSGAMLQVCQAKAEELGFADRCEFHEGYVDSLPTTEVYDAATCFLVSQFLLERAARATFFRHIAERMKPGGVLASADLAADVGTYTALLDAWCAIMTGGAVPPERLAQMHAGYAQNVGILPPGTVTSIVEAGGFTTPVQFFQTSLIHAWHFRRAATLAASSTQ